MATQRQVDVIDWRSERAKTIIKAIEKLDFRIAILSNDQYILGPFEIIRLVNIIYTSKRIRRSLNNFAAMIKKRDNIYENQLEIFRNEKEKNK